MQVATSATVAARPTETSAAAAHMSPETRGILPDEVLDARLGRGTVAGAFNDSVVFRVRGTGDAREFVPDNELSARLLASPAGPRIVRQLEAAARTTDWNAGAANLRGFVLARDERGIAVGDVLAEHDPSPSPVASRPHEMPADDAARAAYLRSTYREARRASSRFGAVETRGWITLYPEVARAMLVSAGAYAPDPAAPGDAPLRRARAMSRMVNGTVMHEVQHTITPREGEHPELRWIEEGTANLFSRTRGMRRRLERMTGVTSHSYASRLGHPAAFDTGWGPWQRARLTGERADAVKREHRARYVNSQGTLRQLLTLAGAGLGSNERIRRSLEILQGAGIGEVPGRMADAIIEHHDLDAGLRDDLAARIATANDEVGAVDRIAASLGLD